MSSPENRQLNETDQRMGLEVASMQTGGGSSPSSSAKKMDYGEQVPLQNINYFMTPTSHIGLPGQYNKDALAKYKRLNVSIIFDH